MNGSQSGLRANEGIFSLTQLNIKRKEETVKSEHVKIDN